MTEFAYNNAENASTSHMLFELNYGYYPQASYKEDIDTCFEAKSADKRATELRKLIIVCRKNL